VRRDVLEEFVEAARLGRVERALPIGLRVHRDTRDHEAARRVLVHAFISMIMVKPKPKRRGWWNRPACTETRWKRGR